MSDIIPSNTNIADLDTLSLLDDILESKPDDVVVKKKVSLSNLCELPTEEISQGVQPRRRGRPRGSLSSKQQPVKRKVRVKPELPDYSHVDPNDIPDEILESLKMTIYSYQAQISGLIVNFLKLFNLLESTVDSTDYIYSLHCNFGHKVNQRILDSGDTELIAAVSKIPDPEKAKKKKTRKPVGDGTCFNTCVEVYIKIDHPGLSPKKFYKMKCSSTTGEIQIPGGRDESLADCRKVVNLFLDHLKKHKICDQYAEIVSENISMKNYKSRINIQPGLDLCTHKLSRYFYNIEKNNLEELSGEYLKPPFNIRETRNPDECPKTSFKFNYGPNVKKDSFRVEIFNNASKVKVGRINFKGTKNDERTMEAYKYLQDVIRLNWNEFIIKQPTISKYDSGDDSDSGSDD